ncbi:hypothetical protein DFJ73DRAFT_284870 [Zopfochytrium polystomum]|nr:hypothetical protein DFJ73DRAFT_284870 [Zopfochytrium polystomum]
MKRRFITGITLNELPALSAALAQNPSIVEVFAAAVMPRALGFCKEFDFGRAHKLLSLLAPYLSGLSLLLRPQGEILNYVAFELQRAGEDSGQVADQKTSNGTALIATKPIDFLQQVVSLHSNLTLAPAEILHLNVYLTAVALKKLNSDGSSLQFVESVYQMAFNLAAVAVAASNDILNFAKCSRCVFQVVDAFLGLTPRENESDAAWLDALSPASEDVISRIFLFSFDLGDLIAGSIQVRESLFSMLKCSGRRNAILHVGAVLAGLLSTVQTERNKVVLENFGPFTIMTAGPSSSWFSAGSANLSRLSAIVKTLPARSTQLVQSAGGELAEFLVRLYDFVLTLEPKCDRCYKTLLCLGDLKFAIGKYEEAAKYRQFFRFISFVVLSSLPARSLSILLIEIFSISIVGTTAELLVSSPNSEHFLSGLIQCGS